VAGIEDSRGGAGEAGGVHPTADEMIRREGAQAAYYGHASVGCLHVRPIIDLKQAPEVAKLRRIRPSKPSSWSWSTAAP